MRVIASSVLALALIYLPACSTESSTGTAGSSGSGGAGVSVTPPDPPGPKDPSDALKMAIFIGSCTSAGAIDAVLGDLYDRKEGDSYRQTAYDVTSCFADKTNGCGAVKECVGISFEPAPVPCTFGCIENTDIYRGCPDIISYLTDCSQLGYTCSPIVNTCVKEPLAPECDKATFMASCADGAPLVCSSGREEPGPICADYGLVCSDHASYGKACVGGGPACNGVIVSQNTVDFGDGIACDGASLRACVNGFEHTVDCSKLGEGFTCQTTPTASFCGLAAECDPGLPQTTECEGDSVVVCNAGRIEKVDCKTLGFTGCDTNFDVCVPGPASLL